MAERYSTAATPQKSSDQSEENTSIYRYRATMTYVHGDQTYVVDPNYIKSIVTDYDYDNNNFPLLYVTLSLSLKIVDQMVLNQGDSYIVFTIQRCVYNSEMPDLWTDYISDRFVYFITEDINKKDDQDYENSNEGREDIFRATTIGMISADLLNRNKKVVNGIMSGPMSSVVYYMLGDRKLLMEPLANNVKLKRLFVSPQNSLSKALKFLNNFAVFYPTPYRFFMDYDCTYMLSSSGNYTQKNDETFNTIIIQAINSYDERSKIQGMSIDEGSGIARIEVSGTDIQLSDMHMSDKSFGKMKMTQTDGKTSTKDVMNTGSVVVAKTKSVRVPNDNTGLIDNVKNGINSNGIYVLVNKNDLNSELVTVNKKYVVQASDVYGDESYNGTYLLGRKRELYIRYDEYFVMSTMLLLRKVEPAQK